MTKFINLETKDKKKTVLTHILDVEKGWVAINRRMENFDKAVYLGNCRVDGDMFACYLDNGINIFKGKVGSEFI